MLLKVCTSDFLMGVIVKDPSEVLFEWVILKGVLIICVTTHIYNLLLHNLMQPSGSLLLSDLLWLLPDTGDSKNDFLNCLQKIFYESPCLEVTAEDLKSSSEPLSCINLCNKRLSICAVTHMKKRVFIFMRSYLVDAKERFYAPNEMILFCMANDKFSFFSCISIQINWNARYVISLSLTYASKNRTTVKGHASWLLFCDGWHSSIAEVIAWSFSKGASASFEKG